MKLANAELSRYRSGDAHKRHCVPHSLYVGVRVQRSIIMNVQRLVFDLAAAAD